MEIDVIEDYATLYDYAEELRRSNRGSTIEIKIERLAPRFPPLFQRFYTCFDDLRRDFLAGCRPILGLDECYLKGIAKWELLTAVARDANNQIFPLAWCVVEVKCTTSWTWFLEILKRDIGTPDGYRWTFISDQQKVGKGPNGFRGKDEARFCKAYFSYNTKCDSTYNNLAKAFNASIVQARSKPVISMLNDIRLVVMEQIISKRKAILGWKESCGPLIRAKLDKSIKESTEWNVHFNKDYGYEIMCGRITYIVDLERMTCSHRLWDLSGIPCAHLVCVVYNKVEDLEKYLAKFYSKEMYMRTNEYDLQPINGLDL
ncbi:hypothetical protein CXB51_013763 [Gossypium anomalum]|uniref:SWIM-type domain-containing protein n=1 Tax=Gossypium anomalum TaxID=47600 RepID=A0A8J6D4B3_9ROSI|nr:hypothetical protein CXB51_013763 [Gossypium anomalum]